MARTDGDTWDLASSVGATATMVASARAMATKADSPLINDPFAEPLVRAVGLDLFTKLATGELSPADRTVSQGWSKHGLNLDMTQLVHFGDRHEASPYLTGPGWEMGGNTIRELFAANGLPPIHEDDLPFADRLYVSGTLTEKK